MKDVQKLDIHWIGFAFPDVSFTYFVSLETPEMNFTQIYFSWNSGLDQLCALEIGPFFSSCPISERPG
jgi:hypothetical protein